MERLEGCSSEVTGKPPLAVSNHLIHSEEDGETATCKNCKTVLKASSCKHKTTRTLKRQIEGCSSEDDDDGPPAKHHRPAPVPPAASWFSQEESAAELARMIAFHGYPSSIVEDECFRSLLHGLNPFFQVPSRAAVERMCHSRAQEAMTQLEETLASCPGQISLATGIAAAAAAATGTGGGEGRALNLACQFVDADWAFQKRIVQVFRVVPFPPYNHSALLGADEVCLDVHEKVLEQFSLLPTTSAVLEDVVRRWGLSGRLFSVAWCQELQEHLRRQDFLDDLCPVPDIQFVRESFRFSAKPAVPVVTYTSDVLDSVAALIHKALNGDKEVACLNTLKGLQLSHEEMARKFSELGLSLNHVGRYDKRWYSYYCALEVLYKEHSEHNPALELEEEEEEEGPDFIETQLAETLSGIRVSRDRSPMPLRNKITIRNPSRHKHRESLFTDLLRKVFGAVYRAIDTISSPSCYYPTSSLCLWEVKKVRDVLQCEARDACLNVPKAIAYSKGCFSPGEDANVVLLEAQGKLDKFMEDSYLYLSIPAVLDPRFKLEGVRSVFSEVFDESATPANISIVEKRIEHMFRAYSEGGVTGGASAAAAMDVDDSNSQEGTATMGIMELERYLEDGVMVVHGDGVEAAGGFDVLQWWKENESRYPTVARMAKDALAMPASDLLSPQHLSGVRSMASSSSAATACVTYP